MGYHYYCPECESEVGTVNFSVFSSFSRFQNSILSIHFISLCHLISHSYNSFHLLGNEKNKPLYKHRYLKTLSLVRLIKRHWELFLESFSLRSDISPCPLYLGPETCRTLWNPRMSLCNKTMVPQQRFCANYSMNGANTWTKSAEQQRIFSP